MMSILMINNSNDSLLLPQCELTKKRFLRLKQFSDGLHIHPTQFNLYIDVLCILYMNIN